MVVCDSYYREGGGWSYGKAGKFGDIGHTGRREHRGKSWVSPGRMGLAWSLRQENRSSSSGTATCIPKRPGHWSELVPARSLAGPLRGKKSSWHWSRPSPSWLPLQPHSRLLCLLLEEPCLLWIEKKTQEEWENQDSGYNSTPQHMVGLWATVSWVMGGWTSPALRCCPALSCCEPVMFGRWDSMCLFAY